MRGMNRENHLLVAPRNNSKVSPFSRERNQPELGVPIKDMPAEVRRRAGTDLMPLFPGEHQGAHSSLFGEAVTERMLAP